ncbi:NAD(P)H-binding protein [uncultured Fibrobacter sp.]|uniref:NAD(P)H-binding protein n=1 Tax=uncultured Fibrobacter sp. TaxID=261512 RepID=UPI00261BFAA1|nr:NAD(P)H-binding protein [uncultured Fibrobacter sp.]
MKVALLGSTGLVGKNVLALLARLPQVVHVFCPVRSIPEERLSPKIDYVQVDFEQVNCFMSDTDVSNRSKILAGLTGCEAVVCCLGTTRKQAGSKICQEKVDLRLPLTLAAIAKKAGVKHFLCVSAQGADSHSFFFYNRLKGMLEEGLTMMDFESLTLVRPSLLLGKHKDRRFGEDLLQKTIGLHPEWIPSFVRPVHAATVAAHLVTSILKPPKDHVCVTDGVKGKRIIYNRVLAKTKVDELF